MNFVIKWIVGRRNEMIEQINFACVHEDPRANPTPTIDTLVRLGSLVSQHRAQ